MKVIKNGDRRGIWRKEVVCTGKGNSLDNAKRGCVPCGAKLEIGARDIFVTYREELWSDDRIYYYTIKCPCCGTLTDLAERQLPEDVKNFALKREEKDVDKDELRFKDEDVENEG